MFDGTFLISDGNLSDFQWNLKEFGGCFGGMSHGGGMTVARRKKSMIRLVEVPLVSIIGCYLLKVKLLTQLNRL
jgi:hypothetical protein